MVDFQGPDGTIAVFTATYEHYLQAARGFAANSCKLHLRVVRSLLRTRAGLAGRTGRTPRPRPR